jgi:hypothetical protein
MGALSGWLRGRATQPYTPKGIWGRCLICHRRAGGQLALTWIASRRMPMAAFRCHGSMVMARHPSPLRATLNSQRTCQHWQPVQIDELGEMAILPMKP